MIPGYKEFLELRQETMKAVEKICLDCDHYKSYEGTFELIFGYPDIFSDYAFDDCANFFQIRFHCYLLGPARHYEWSGNTLFEAVKKAKKDIYKWIKEEEAAN